MSADLTTAPADPTRRQIRAHRCGVWASIGLILVALALLTADWTGLLSLYPEPDNPDTDMRPEAWALIPTALTVLAVVKIDFAIRAPVNFRNWAEQAIAAVPVLVVSVVVAYPYDYDDLWVPLTFFLGLLASHAASELRAHRYPVGVDRPRIPRYALVMAAAGWVSFAAGWLILFRAA